VLFLERPILRTRSADDVGHGPAASGAQNYRSKFSQACSGYATYKLRMSINSISHGSFVDVLPFAGRSPRIPAEHDLYGWLVGSWDLDLTLRDDQGASRTSQGEVHFSWVLQGTAVQDVWIGPRLTPGAPWPGGAMYGTTLRMYDHSIEAWRVFWFNGPDGARRELIGRRHERDIVQEGTTPEGIPVRWSFTDIASNSFRWLGERMIDGAWRLYAEFHGRRRK
jgi:hypothetical protein